MSILYKTIVYEHTCLARGMIFVFLTVSRLFLFCFSSFSQVFQRVYLDYRVPDWASQEIRDMGFWRKRANPRGANRSCGWWLFRDAPL